MASRPGAQSRVLREAAPHELAEIEALVQTAYREYQPLMPEAAWERWQDSIRQTIHNPAGTLVVAEEAGRIEGVVQFYEDANKAAMGSWPPGAGAIRILAVSPAARGRGLGTRLTGECLARARELHLAAIYLYTGTFMQAARHIYEKMGFVRAPEFERDPGPIAYRLKLE